MPIANCEPVPTSHRGVLFDQAEVVSTAIEHERVERVVGNFFKEIPVEADAYIFRNIIHDWNDEKSLSILRTLRKATKPHARVMLLEWVIPDTSDFHLGKWTDMVMMTGVSGRERTRGDFETLFSDAGFVLEDVVPTESIRQAARHQGRVSRARAHRLQGQPRAAPLRPGGRHRPRRPGRDGPRA